MATRVYQELAKNLEQLREIVENRKPEEGTAVVDKTGAAVVVYKHQSNRPLEDGSPYLIIGGVEALVYKIEDLVFPAVVVYGEEE